MINKHAGLRPRVDYKNEGNFGLGKEQKLPGGNIASLPFLNPHHSERMVGKPHLTGLGEGSRDPPGTM